MYFGGGTSAPGGPTSGQPGRGSAPGWD